MKKTLLSGLFAMGLLCLNVLYAQQEIISQVIDENGEPLIFATIAITKNSEFQRATLTDFDGIFHAVMFEDEEVKISYMGQQDQQFTFDKIFETDLVRMKEGITLDVIVVTAQDKKCSHCCYEYINLSDSPSPKQINLSLDIQSNWRYYPNPTNDIITFENEMEKDGIISIYAISGALVAQHSISQIPFQLDIGSFAAGTYVVKYQEEGKVETIGRVVKI